MCGKERIVASDRKTVEVSRVYKSFGGTTVVKDISFEVRAGEIFGLVGPNGAGKTTTIRMLMDIIKADSGEVKILSEVLHESTKNRIGYLPEERGLYRKITISETLDYLSALKGFDRGLARERGRELLQRLGMLQHQRKKIDELSKGMGQIIQFLVTVIHDPDLVILDEPFASLDPVNVKLIKELIFELKGRGKTIILSTHMMNEVEELCDRILMIDRGQAVLYGNLAEIKSRYRNNSVLFEGEGNWNGIEGVVGSKDHGKYTELFLDGHTTPQEVLAALMRKGVRIDRFEVSTPSLNEIFIQVVEGER
ncbi:MAG: sodium ABC transporter [Chloroflexi bacterium RBG_13_54_9]|nr:MAG: sodium ABC transporter [Chloroflexi bacterium RBG_13_54_9]